MVKNGDFKLKKEAKIGKDASADQFLICHLIYKPLVHRGLAILPVFGVSSKIV
jgi:hypothetical protein